MKNKHDNKRLPAPRFWASQCGTVAILFALAAIPVLIVAGAGVDYVKALKAHTELQRSLDGAALAAANVDTDSDTDKEQVALEYLAANFAGVVKNPLVSVDEATVTVSADAVVPTAFMTLVGISQMMPNASATATKNEGYPVCLMALNPTMDKAVFFKGNSILDAPNCVVQSNSTSSDGLHSQGTVSASALHFCSTGGHSGPFEPNPEDGCPAVNDPFADLPAPADTTCDPGKTNLKFKNEEATLIPGVYCGGIKSWNNAILHFEPGLYVIKDGPLDIGNGVFAEGDGVTFYLTGTNSGFMNSSGASMDFSAPTTGDYAAILFYQDPASNPGNVNTIIAGSLMEFAGVIYLPTQALNIQGSGEINALSPHVSIVADNLIFGGAAKLNIRNDPVAFGLPANLMTIKDIVRLIK